MVARCINTQNLYNYLADIYPLLQQIQRKSDLHDVLSIFTQTGGFMITSKELTGKPIISIADGKRLGDVKDLYLDGEIHQVVGVYLGSEGIIKRKEMMIARDAVQVSGIDVWLVSSSDIVKPREETPDSELYLLIGNMRGREIQTDGGTKLGTVEDVLLDDELRVLGFSLGKVYAQGPLAERKAVIRDAIKDLGSKDTPMVADLALAESGIIPSE